MTPEEITAMAREAGFGRNGFSECLVRSSRGVWIDVQDEVNRLVALVAEKAEATANERANKAWRLMCEKMVAAEREACADIVENADTPDCGGWTAQGIADAIRARGQKGGV